MDEVQDYLTSFYKLYSKNSSTFNRIISAVNRCTSAFQNYIFSTLDRLVRNLAAKPDVASVLLLIVLLFVSLKLLNLLYQTVMFWIRLVFRLAFWSCIIGVVAWVCMRGPDGVADDVQNLSDVWQNEYSYWTSKQGQGWLDGARRGLGLGNQARGRVRAAGRW